MEDAEAASSPSTEPAGKEPSEKAFNLPEQLRRNLALLEQAVALKELRLISGRLQRQTAAVRRELTAPVLLDVVQDALPTGTPIREQLLQHLQKVMRRHHQTSTSMQVAIKLRVGPRNVWSRQGSLHCTQTVRAGAWASTPGLGMESALCSLGNCLT